MSVIQTTEGVQTTAVTTQAPTAVTADSMLTWTQMEDTAPADQGSYRMMLHSLVMVSRKESYIQFMYYYMQVCSTVHVLIYTQM